MLNLKPFENPGWTRTTRKNPCPICNKYGWCEVSNDGTTAHCMHEASDRPFDFRQGGYLHSLQIGFKNVTIGDLKPAPKLEPLSLAQVDAVNRRILELCPLSPGHAAYLVAEGVPTTGPGTFRYKDAARIARQLVSEFGESIARRHPAIIELTGKAGSKYWTLSAYGDGLLFPARSIDGLVLGLQIRHDSPKGKNDRYRWVSSDGKGGTPLAVFKADPIFATGNLTILTEGYKKAAAASEYYGYHAVGLAGVSSYKITELIETLDQLKTSEIWIAFDADKTTNKEVQRAETRLIELISAARPGLLIKVMNWDGEQSKGLDDALKAKLSFTFEPVKKGTKVVHGLPLRTDTQKARPIYTLAQARQGHADLFQRLLTQEESEQIAVTSVTGTGKSTGADNAVAGAALAGTLSKRTLILAPSSENLQERTRPGTLLGEAIKAGKAVIQQGRNVIDPDNLPENFVPTPFDCRNPEAAQAGQARQIPAKIVCSTCPFGSAENWKKAHPEDENKPGDQRPWKCEEEGYLASRKRSELADVVVATKESYLNGSKSLLCGKKEDEDGILSNGFKAVFADEELLPKLIDSVELGNPQIASWKEAIVTRNLPVDSRLLTFFDVLKTALSLLSDRYPAAKAAENDERLNSLFPVMDVLKEAAEKEGGVLLESFLASLPSPEHKNDTYSFELHYKEQEKLKIPFRALADFLEALESGDLRVKARRSTNGNFTFVFTKIKKHLVDYLNTVTLVVLDATLPPGLKALFPAMKEISFDVPQALEIWQTANSMYTSRGMYNETTRNQIKAVGQHFFAGAARPLAYVPMRFEEEFNFGTGATIEHWGRHRATNQYQDCDALLLTGHFMRPISDISFEVDTLRSYGYLPPAPSAGIAAPEKLRLYNFAENGLTSGRWCRNDSDPELQKAIEADYSANIIQAIGRLRAALRPADNPARVLILCADPVENLKIDRLTTVKDLLQEELPVYQKIPTPLKSNFLLINILGETQKTGVGIFSSHKPEVDDQSGDMLDYFTAALGQLTTLRELNRLDFELLSYSNQPFFNEIWELSRLRRAQLDRQAALFERAV